MPQYRYRGQRGTGWSGPSSCHVYETSGMAVSTFTQKLICILILLELVVGLDVASQEKRNVLDTFCFIPSEQTQSQLSTFRNNIYQLVHVKKNCYRQFIF